MKTDGSALEEATALLRSAKTRIAVVGASNDPSKYGNIIVKNLMAHGYRVLPVNPKEATIAGLPAFRSLADVPKPVDIVDVVTPPAVTHRVLEDASKAGIGLVWLQDGSFDQTVLDASAAAPFKTVHHACIMVVARQAVRPSPKAEKS
jgi:predicted CoA-binding protein